MTHRFKKHSPDFKDFEEFRKKRLDKTADLLYNIRTRVVDMDVIPFTDPLFKNYRYGRVLADGLDILEKARQAVKKADFGGAPPVLAGGFVRDIFFGYHPKDIDVFIPTPDGRDPDDYAVYVLSLLDGRDLLEILPKFDPSYGETGNFIVYGSSSKTTGSLVDFITDCGSSADEIISRFDYDLVRCYIDEEGLHLTDEFRAAVKSKKVTTDNLKTKARIESWRRRNDVNVVVDYPGKAEELNPRIWGQQYFSKARSAAASQRFDLDIFPPLRQGYRV